MSTTAERAREYRIAPRYLADAIPDVADAVTPLIAAGWSVSNDEVGNAYLTAPDLRARLAYLPEGEDSTLWKISAGPDAFAPPEWLVTFDSGTPTEIVQDFVVALADAYSRGPDHYLGASSLTRTRVFDPLLAAGWSPATPFSSIQSPDQLVRLHRRTGHLQHAKEMTGDTERWLFEIGPPRHIWYATASTHLPDHLLQQLTTAITNPAPAIRHMKRYQLDLLPAQAVVTPTAPSPLEMARIRAATARSVTMPRAPTSALAYTTATPRTALPQPALTGRSR
ncbi:DUF317 domain-containing protein [Kitasatospora sp. LaBMicrA B282]|uniref:DUF317 domain-containing protein n=1 Tax=Kitasatospora sp. LaBMicrA B282 TaxID=3420949 RepID=UPI003D0DD4FE